MAEDVVCGAVLHLRKQVQQAGLFLITQTAVRDRRSIKDRPQRAPPWVRLYVGLTRKNRCYVRRINEEDFLDVRSTAGWNTYDHTFERYLSGKISTFQFPVGKAGTPVSSSD